jgi:HK97 family phage prohead protease
MHNMMTDNDDTDEFAALLRREMLKLRLTELEVALRRAGERPIDWKKLPPVQGAVQATFDVALEVKSAAESDDGQTGVIDGYLSTWDIDLGKDQIEKGAFKQTLAEAKEFAARHGSAAIYPLLWQHDKNEPIGGIVSAHEDFRGLRIKTHLNLSIERGRQAYHGLKHGYLSFSIGYRPVKYDWQGGIRHLNEIALAEGSAVTFPMNLEARATPNGEGRAA